MIMVVCAVKDRECVLPSWNVVTAVSLDAEALGRSLRYVKR